jgi:prevent-host-death family protein
MVTTVLVDLKRARRLLADLVDRVVAGEEIVITRRGQAVARLVQAGPIPKQLPSLAGFRKKITRMGTPASRLLREERGA